MWRGARTPKSAVVGAGRRAGEGGQLGTGGGGGGRQELVGLGWVMLV